MSLIVDQFIVRRPLPHSLHRSIICSLPGLLLSRHPRLILALLSSLCPSPRSVAEADFVQRFVSGSGLATDFRARLLLALELAATSSDGLRRRSHSHETVAQESAQVSDAGYIAADSFSQPASVSPQQCASIQDESVRHGS